MTDFKETLEKLSSKFPENLVGHKTGFKGGPTLSYISHAIVTEHLNKLAPNWKTRLLEVYTYNDAQGMIHCAGVSIEMEIDGVTRVESGGPQRQDGFANEIKNAMSDAIKRCAMRFGVALYIWDKLVDAEFDEDVHPDYAQSAAPAPKPMPGANIPPNGAARLDVKGQPRPQQAAAPTPIRPPQTGPYGDYAPKGCNMDVLNEYLRANGFTGGKMGDCIKELHEWVHNTFHVEDKVIGTGDPDPAKPQYGPRTWPSDVFNYAAHFIQQCDEPEEATAAVSAAAGGIHLPDDDQVPF